MTHLPGLITGAIVVLVTHYILIPRMARVCFTAALQGI